MGKNVVGKNVLWGKLSVGKNVVGKIVWGKMSWGKLSFGEKCYRANLDTTKFIGERGQIVNPPSITSSIAAPR